MPHNNAEQRVEASHAPSDHRPVRPDDEGPRCEATHDDVLDWFDLAPTCAPECQKTPDELACLSLTSVDDPASDADGEGRLM